MSKTVVTRWALVLPPRGKGRWTQESVLLGRYCWPDASPDEIPTRTFRTREDAREARKAMTSYRKEARVVPVRVVVEFSGKFSEPT